MLKMQKLLIGSLLLMSANAFAKDAIKILNCKSSSTFQRFQVVLDPSTYREGSGYYVPKNASLVDNYYAVQNMTCVGSVPSNIECLGYANGISAIIMEARSGQDARGNLFLTYSVIRGEGPADTTLKCELQELHH